MSDVPTKEEFRKRLEDMHVEAAKLLDDYKTVCTLPVSQITIK